MTEIETWEPNTAGAALDILDRARALIAQAQDTDDITLIRDQAEAMAAYARRRDGAQEAAMAATEIVIRCERRMAELYAELREAGRTRKPGRPKQSLSSDDNDSLPVGADIFTNAQERQEALFMARFDEDTFNEAIDAARAKGRLTRRAVMAELPADGPARGGANAGRPRDDVNIGSVMPRLLRALRLVVDGLAEYDPSTIEHEDRKNWGAQLSECVKAIEVWRKALPK